MGLFLWSSPLASLNLAPECIPWGEQGVTVGCPSLSSAQRLSPGRIDQLGALGLKSKSSALTPVKYPLSGVDSLFPLEGLPTLGC